MTSRWGPMGWMTLHSISVCYPEIASNEDRQIISRFLDRFAECITCPTCKSHFVSIYGTYRSMYPDWANSRFNLFVMMCRLHNTVNKRLDKPSPATVAESIQTLKAATKITSPAVFRSNYIQYVMQNWSYHPTGEGFVAAGAAREMRRLNVEYFTPREVSYDSLNFPEADLLRTVPENTEHYRVGNGIPSYSSNIKTGGFRFRGGRLTFVRN